MCALVTGVQTCALPIFERRWRGGAGKQWHVGQRRCRAGAAKKGATLWVVAGFEPLKFVTPALERWLHRLDNEGVTLGGIDTGSVVLAVTERASGRQRVCT